MAKEKKEEVLVDATGETVVEAKESKSVFSVFSPEGKFVRDYTLEIHGEDAGKLAKQFAKKIGGEVK